MGHKTSFRPPLGPWPPGQLPCGLYRHLLGLRTAQVIEFLPLVLKNVCVVLVLVEFSFLLVVDGLHIAFHLLLLSSYSMAADELT